MAGRAFITSTGRTGTHFLAYYLNKHRLCHAEHQPLARDKTLPVAQRTWDFAAAYTRGHVDFETACRWLVERGFGEMVEVNPHLYALLKPLETVWPDAKFVWVVRDPVGFCRSGFKRGYYLDEVKENRLCAPNYDGDPYRALWPQLSRVQKIAWLWRFQNLLICRDLPARVIAVRFEDIITPPYVGMRRILRFLGFDEAVDQRTMAEVQSPSKAGGPEIPPEQLPRLLQIALDWTWREDAVAGPLVEPYAAGVPQPVRS